MGSESACLDNLFVTGRNSSRALGLTEDLLLGRVPGDAARELDQKLPGETR